MYPRSQIVGPSVDWILAEVPHRDVFVHLFVRRCFGLRFLHASHFSDNCGNSPCAFECAQEFVVFPVQEDPFSVASARTESSTLVVVD